jgi:predicted AAA+ superfamily ATPase
MLRFVNVARDCAIDAKTVKEYYQILVDTLLGYFINPYAKQIKRDLITATPKFYLFDVGVINYIAKRRIAELRGSQAGEAFEHYILMELIAYRGLNHLDFDITFWRTKSGLEVDFVLGRAEVAIEVKISDSVSKADLHGIIAFQEEYNPRQSIVVSMVAQRRKLVINENQSILIMPWQEFLQELWGGHLEVS